MASACLLKEVIAECAIPTPSAVCVSAYSSYGFSRRPVQKNCNTGWWRREVQSMMLQWLQLHLQRFPASKTPRPPCAYYNEQLKLHTALEKPTGEETI